MCSFNVRVIGRECDACGDDAVKLHNGRPLCNECFNEIVHKQVGPPPRSTFKSTDD